MNRPYGRHRRAAALGLLMLLIATPVYAHGEATGAQEFLQHNLVTIGFLAVILLAAAALVWVNRPGRNVSSSGAQPTPKPSDLPPE